MTNRQACANPDHRHNWRVGDRKCNYSAFNGYRRTPSDYSSVHCLECGACWRTKASYVDDLPDVAFSGGGLHRD